MGNTGKQSQNSIDDMLVRVHGHLRASIATKERLIDECSHQIIEAAQLIAAAFERKNKIMLCGNGGSAADSQHIAAELVSVLSQDFQRPALPAIAMTTDSSILTASANDFGFEGIFERQVQALGLPGDIVVGISTSGNSENVICALEYARNNGLHTIGLLGMSGGRLAELSDVAIIVPSDNVQNIQEAHIVVGHLLCDLCETILFSDYEVQTE